MKRMLLPDLTVFAAILGLAACSGMSDRQRDTAAGAAIGGVAGSVLSDGSPAGTVGGAAIGGVIGNQVGKKKEEDRRN
jgi:osmotically inducible lipoprotein OsmB